MAILLKDMRVGMADKVAAQVVDTFIRESEVLELIPFDDTVSPGGGGSTLIYGYVQTKTPSATAFRALNTEYKKSEAKREKKSVELKIFGGAFDIDRVVNDAKAQYDNVAFQMEEKVISAVGTFHNAFINGDSATDANSFDGLDKMLVGQKTEYNTDKVIDLSNTTKITENANEFYEALLKLINQTGAHALLVNEGMKTKIQTVARILGYKTESETAFGRTVTSINEGKVRLIDLKNYVTPTEDGEAGEETPIIGVKERTVGGQAYTGLTDIYGVKFDVNTGVHAATLTGDKVIKQFLPDFNTPGAVKTGEVEMVAAVVLKNTKSAGVLRNIKIN